MNKNPTGNYSMAKTGTDDDFDMMGDSPSENPVLAERRRLRDNEITKKLGEYLLKGYCMLSDACPECDCILLRTPDRQLLCVGCSEIDAGNKKNEVEEAASKKKEPKTRGKKERVKKEPTDSMSNCAQLENKLRWAVNELTTSQNPTRISEMCAVIVKLTEAIKALKEHEQAEN